MKTAVLYSGRENDRTDVLDLTGTAREWGVSRPTVYQWIYLKLAIPKLFDRVGRRHVIAFDPTYVAEVKAVLPRKGSSAGGAVLTPEIEDKIRAVNKRFYPDRAK
jgi:hypothetical protein